MKPLGKTLSALLLCGGSVAAWVFGTELVRDARFARAAEEVEATREELASVDDLASVFRSVGKVVEPSVVHIIVRRPLAESGLPPEHEEWLRKFLPDRDGDGEPDLPEGGGGGGFGDLMMGQGSGVIMEVNGNEAFIVTNNHVAGGASGLTITLSDGRTIEGASVVGTDAKTDLAVIKVQADNLIAAQWGDSDGLQKGDWILAFGSPFGYVGSMTHGIISALNRDQVGIIQSPFAQENFIQVDAQINPGNSGGPLVNTKGEVIGINTAIASNIGRFQGVGFAIPVNQVKFVYDALKEKGKVTRGWLGVGIEDVARNPEQAKALGYNGEAGVLIRQTYPETPAHGVLRPGDIVTAINGKDLKNNRELRTTVAQTEPGTELKLNVFRDGKTEEVMLKVGEQPEELANLGPGRGPGGAVPQPETTDTMGMTLQTPNDQLAEQLGLGADREGAVVTALEATSAAAAAGIQVGDVITRIGDQTIKDAEQAAEVLAKQADSKSIPLYLKSGQTDRLVFIEPRN